MQVTETDLGRLAVYLKALANPNRLALLHGLRVPTPVSEIRLHPQMVGAGENPQRRISDQAVRDHLAKLRQVGVVATQRRMRDGALVDHYVLDHPRLFAVIEELRGLGELRADGLVSHEETLPGADGVDTPSDQGPALLLVRGQDEGRRFALRPSDRARGRGWIIGRKEGLAVTLDYDPFVSSEHAEVVVEGDTYTLIDLRSNRNGTARNFHLLERGASVPLQHGDVISVGRTHMVFHTDA